MSGKSNETNMSFLLKLFNEYKNVFCYSTISIQIKNFYSSHSSSDVHF